MYWPPHDLNPRQGILTFDNAGGCNLYNQPPPHDLNPRQGILTAVIGLRVGISDSPHMTSIPARGF